MSTPTPNRKSVVWSWGDLQRYDEEDECPIALTERDIAAILTALGVMRWKTRWHDYDSNEAQIIAFTETLISKLTESECANGISSFGVHSGGNGDTASDGGFDDFIEILGEIMPKFRIDGKLYEPVIDLVPCDCGSGDGGDGGDNAASYGGTTGGWDSLSTLCDIVTNTQALIVSRVEDLHDRLANFRWAFDAALPDEYVSWIDAIIESIDEINVVLDDASFLEVVQAKVARQFPDPVPSSGITREDLVRLASAIPVVYEGAPMRPMFELWARVANIQEINAQIKTLAGTGDSEVCTEAFSGSGREPFTKPNTTPELTVVAGGNYGVITLFDGTMPFIPNFSDTIVDSADEVGNFEGVIVVASGFGANISGLSTITYKVEYGGTDYTNVHKSHEVAANKGVFTNRIALAQTIAPEGVFGDLAAAEYKAAFTPEINNSVNSSLPDTVSNIRTSAKNSNNSSGTVTVLGVYVVVNLSV